MNRQAFEQPALVVVQQLVAPFDRPVQVIAEFTDPSMKVTLRDWGHRFDVTMLPKEAPRDPLKPGGVGLICLRQLMDDITFTPMDEGTLLTMTRKRTSRGRRRA